MPIQTASGLLQQGSSGPNVASLQAGLNQALPYEMPKLMTDGVFGMKTRTRVLRFQQMKGLKQDGLVGPKTLAALGSGGPPSAPGIPGAPPVVTPAPDVPAEGISRFKAEMQEEFDKQGKSSMFIDFVNDFEQNTIPGWKTFLGGISRVEDARTVVNFYMALRTLGFTGSQLSTVLGQTVRLNKDALTFFEVVSAPAGKFGKALKFAGGVANAAGLITTAIECILHARRGDYAVIPAEIYKFAMGKAVPWAALIEGIGSLLDGIVPEQARNNSIVYKVLRSLDPIGLGAVAVDAMGSLATGAFQMIVQGKASDVVMLPRLQRLVTRMKGGPANIFVQLGENSGDALYELSQTGIDFESIMRYSWMELTDWIKN